jgi:pimeloyl-ACP methyl ester carboxylesterase
MSQRSGGILFIHGGEHGAWCWDRVRALLEYDSVAIDLPGRGVAPRSVGLSATQSFVRHAQGELDATGWDDVVLVAHSLGGLTAGRLAEVAGAKIVHIVFVACLLPPHGGTAIDGAPPYLRPIVSVGVRAALRRGGAHMLPRPVARYLFCNGLAPADVDAVLGRRCAEPAQVILDRFFAVLPESVPRTWVLPSRDRAIPPRRQRRTSSRLGVREVVEVDAGHDVMVSHPAQVASLLNRIARESLA